VDIFIVHNRRRSSKSLAGKVGRSQKTRHSGRHQRRKTLNSPDLPAAQDPDLGLNSTESLSRIFAPAAPANALGQAHRRLLAAPAAGESRRDASRHQPEIGSISGVSMAARASDPPVHRHGLPTLHAGHASHAPHERAAALRREQRSQQAQHRRGAPQAIAELQLHAAARVVRRRQRAEAVLQQGVPVARRLVPCRSPLEP